MIKNKLKIITLFVFAGSIHIDAVGNYLSNLPHYIENLSVYEENQEPPRCYYMPAESKSLNGTWKFQFYNKPSELPGNCFLPSLNDRKWNDIQVPSNWEMQGFGDPLFRNMAVPFNPNPPYVPQEYNPTGCYRTTFTIPENWDGKEIFLRMDKVASASFLWINGRQLGYNEGAHEPAEYRITPFLKKGSNQLTVVVMKYCAGFYLEDQDYWRLAGIFDNVTIYAAPKIRLFDWQIITDMNSQYNQANLKINATVKAYQQPQQNGTYQMEATLTDEKGNQIATCSSSAFHLTNTGNHEVSLSSNIDHPALWSAESPNLYRLKMKLTDQQGKIIDTTEVPVGFKETKIINGVFYLNGKNIKLNAINSHSQHPVMGHCMDEKTIRRHFEILKQFNFNAVRTSHYPPPYQYIKLANEYGLYIIDEVGDEAHSTEWVSGKPEFRAMYEDRTRQLVTSDRNTPCVLFWSAGNESGEGENITHVVETGKKLDPTRYWMYGGNAFSHPAEDIIGPRYPFPLEHELQVGLVTGSDSVPVRPSFLDEYLSVAGNGGGGMDEYWDNFYKYPRMMGGAIWDFVSPGLKEDVKTLRDLSPYHNDVNIIGNGKLVKVDGRTCLDLDGHDEWAEVYRSHSLDIDGNGLTVYMSVMPRKLEHTTYSYLTKGDNQFGICQKADENQLTFYIYTDQRHEIKASLPDNWYGRWHQMAGTYQDGTLRLYIDGVKSAEQNIGNANITNMPYQINIGRNAEKEGVEDTHYTCNALIDQVVVMNHGISSTDNLHRPTAKSEALLWLDFDKMDKKGVYYSYGIGARTYGSIWPDRTVQPEMWQFKHAAQPIACQWYDKARRQVEITNRNAFLPTSQYQHTWALQADGVTVDSGTVRLDDIRPGEKQVVDIPYDSKNLLDGKEYFLLISSKLKSDCIWAGKGHEVAWSQLDVACQPAAYTEHHTDGSNPLTCNENDSLLTVNGKGFCYTFNKRKGMLSAAVINGKKVIDEGPKMNVWRAPLANELDDWNAQTAKSVNWRPGMGWRVAAEFYSFGLGNLIHKPLDFSYRKTSEGIDVWTRDVWLCNTGNKVEKLDLYIEGKPNDGFINTYHYVIANDGTVRIDHQLGTSGRMPLYLPRVGLTMQLAEGIDQIKWYGRGPQENYPDRKTGYRIGSYASTIDKMFEPYLIPQDCGLRSDDRWMSVTDREGTGFLVEEYEPTGIQSSLEKTTFNFNAYHYTTDNLTRATYPFQLHPISGATLNIDYETSGVGCTCRGIFDNYKVRPSSIERTTVLHPIQTK